MDEDNMEVLDSETQDVSGDDDVNEESYDSDTSSESETDEEIEKARKIASDQKRRAEKAERELKELKSTLPKKTEPQSEGQPAKASESNGLTREEAILFAKGLSQEQVDKAVSIAKLEGVNPLVAAESDYFQFWKTEQEKKAEAENTQLGASRGSAKIKPKKDFDTPGLTPEEHKALWKEKMGR